MFRRRTFFLIWSVLVFFDLIKICLGEELEDDNQKLSFLLDRYLDMVKSKQPKQQYPKDDEDSINQPMGDLTERKTPTSINLTGGFPARLAIGPGDSPRSATAFNKRKESQKSEAQACKNSEWFVYLDDMPACVHPLWDGGYDPTFCVKMKTGWVYCSCNGEYTFAMKEGLDTCILKKDLKRGRCSNTPCPRSYKCVDHLSERRYDCVRDNLKVPVWY